MPGSLDFLDGALEQLEKDPEAQCIVLVGYPGDPGVHRYAKISNREQLEWFKRAAERLFAQLEETL